MYVKISKVKHTRAAVALKESGGSGILYSVPSKQQNSEITNLEKHIENLNGTAQRLYNLFNNKNVYDKKDNKDLSFLESDITKFFSHAIKNYVMFNQNITPKDIISKLEVNFTKACTLRDKKTQKETKINIYQKAVNAFGDDYEDKTDKFIKEIFHERLKNSLRKDIQINGKAYKVADQLSLLAARLIFKRSTRFTPNTQVVKEVLTLVSNDYYKKKQIKALAESIKKNNVRVQVDSSTGKLILSNALNGSKKRTVFEFINRYANLDEQAKNEKLKQIRVLIILYVCGEAAYREALDGNLMAWSWGSHLPEDKENFSDEAVSKLMELAELPKESKLKKSAREQVRIKIAEAIRDSYRAAYKVVKDDAEAEYWIAYFEQSTEKIFCHRFENNIKLGKAHLCRELFRNWQSYVALKFIEMGKAVYNFACPSPYDVKNGVTFGKVLPEYAGGITSFDYEKIKAEETLSRNLAVSATYASNVFAYNIVAPENRYGKNMEDPLYYKENKETHDLSERSREDAVRRILQFFGGQSKWEYKDFEKIEFIKGIRESIKCIRNHSYHYTPKIREIDKKATALACRLFDGEYARYSAVYMEKYYSNNAPMFYAKADIVKLLGKLYGHKVERPDQIPSFANVLGTKEFKAVIDKEISSINSVAGGDAEVLKKLRAAIYFMFKEIYYNGFLQEADIYSKFDKALKLEDDEVYKSKDRNRQNSMKDFKARINDIGVKDFPILCQTIMTDVNMQNQGNKAVKTARQKDNDEKNGKGEIYKHYKMLLWKVLQKAFINYVKERKEYRFIFSPQYRENFSKEITVEGFCTGWQAGTFEYLKSMMKDNNLLLAWYIVAHFLPTKQLNLLKGDIKSYIQYVKNISSRANSIKVINKVNAENIKYYDGILSVLDFVSLFAGRISHEVTDYFTNDEAYFAYLDNFVEFDPRTSPIFSDEKNPIINRGVVLSVMYGMESILKNIDYKVSQVEYDNYEQKKKKLTALFKKVACENITEQRQLNDFQQLKNRIELRDLLSYTEMIMDNMSQLVSFAYFRERDFMYFQLGVHYLRLFYGDSIPETSHFRQMKGKDVNIHDGALLYQLISLHTPGLSIRDKDGNRTDGFKYEDFSEVYCGEKFEEGKRYTYENCMNLFVKYNEEDAMIKLRNSIDHMKYITGSGKSLIDYYSDIYNGFFQYDTKLKKSVSYILKNIFMRYFLVLKLEFRNTGNDKPKLQLSSVGVDQFTYKFIEKGYKGKDINKTYKENAKSDKFIEIATNLLNYK